MIGRHLAVIAALAVLAPVAGAQAHPDLNGIWQVESRSALTGGEPMAPIDGSPIPFQPWSKAIEQAQTIMIRRMRADIPPNNQRCLVAGTVRAMKGNFPWRLIQMDKQILILYEEDNRENIIPFRASHNPGLPRTWWGDSIARWNGDTLVVDQTNFNGKTPLPEGILITQLLHVVHHFHLIDGGAKLEDDILIDDPGAFTRSFTTRSVFDRVPPPYKLKDYRCAEDNEDLPAALPWWHAYWGPN